MEKVWKELSRKLSKQEETIIPSVTNGDRFYNMETVRFMLPSLWVSILLRWTYKAEHLAETAKIISGNRNVVASLFVYNIGVKSIKIV